LTNFNGRAKNADGKYRHVAFQFFLLHILLQNLEQGNITIPNTYANKITKIYITNGAFDVEQSFDAFPANLVQLPQVQKNTKAEPMVILIPAGK
jgi:hypothetical protein